MMISRAENRGPIGSILRAPVAHVLLAWSVCCVAADAQSPSEESPAADRPETAPAAEDRQLFTGRVVLLDEALKRRGLQIAEEMANQAVLETDDGELIPLLADWRGRAFFQDERLRHRKVELVGTRRAGLPYLQVLMVFTFDEEGNRQYTDYWCDVCSIPMYEIQPCDCCQGEIRLRYRKQDLPDYLHRGPAGDSSDVD